MNAPATEDLEALFDRISAERAAAGEAAPPGAAGPSAAPPAAASAGGDESYDVFQRIGALTRSLHDALRELGYDKSVQQAVESLPYARDRLAYIAEVTGRAAEKVLGAVETGQAAQSALQAEAARLHGGWHKLYAGELGTAEFKALAGETREFLTRLPDRVRPVDECLHEVMMAQDFHDLTGQVIQKVVQVARNLEEQLVKLLIEATPPERRTAIRDEWLSGPAAGRTDPDIVTGQAQVDSLLESLGF